MRLYNYLNELKSNYASGITFVDLDETLFHTFAEIKVLKDDSVIKSLNNQEFNTYELNPGESYDFSEFRSAELFRKTSIPIESTVKRIKRMFTNIDIRGSEIIFLTARADFDDKHMFLNTFRDHGIPIDNIYVERAGNMNTGTTSERKKSIVLKYLSTGKYRRCRLIDDDMTNIKTFLKIEKELPQNIINKVKERYNIPDDENFPVIQFFGLLVLPNGKLKNVQGA